MSSDGKEGKQKDNEEATECSGASGGGVAEGEDDNEASLGLLQRILERIGLNSKIENEEENIQVLDEVTFNGIAKYIQSDKCKNIVVMAGAGISTAAGIPDFRTPGSGLYDNLQKYNLPYPEAVFDIGFFRSKPEPFFKLAKELYPGNFKPTTSHYFIRLLNKKGLLLRHYTQNIDTLERVAGIPGEKLVEAHGTFHTAHCLRCRKSYTQDWIKREVFTDKIPTCEKDNCKGVVKPDIVFFGESLPDRFSKLLSKDMPKCDLLIIMGTSLVVQPFASLVDHVPNTTPRLLINREKCGQQQADNFFLYGGGTGLMFDDPKNYRDVAWLGSCDNGCTALADLLGWKDELIKMVNTEHKKIDDKFSKQNEPQEDIRKNPESFKRNVEKVESTVTETDKPKECNKKNSDIYKHKECEGKNQDERGKTVDVEKKGELNEIEGIEKQESKKSD